ncbi:hypothetical protein GCM10011390_06870 [Aureimonas endophytica]|uniref:Secreted protein n=1 Tax=Aureimonas endophytica TaxID=2027858 RepID=A0A917E0X2_9HYPH|nr:hypothetical protein [Aureimonas endophytica]GGD90766.1 hypothetical protein GCM10011390_06870 [Aureimonas endophytica]
MRRAFLAALLALAAVSPAAAHGSGAVGPIEGIAIPSLTHGQMAVLQRWNGEILAEAARQPRSDERFRRIANYAALQRAACLWGLVPGSIANEESSFNGCMHATLAAERQLIVEMRRLTPERATLADLAERIERDMLSEGASLVLCRHSAEDFDTARIVAPDWPIAQAGVAPLAALAGGVLLLAGLARSRYRSRTRH